MAHTSPSASDPEHPRDHARAGDTGAVRRSVGGPLLSHRRGPFSWQHGDRLLLLEANPLSWVLAELRFDATTCCYQELRRFRYRWGREATGSLLSRVLATGEATAEQTARDLDAWLIRDEPDLGYALGSGPGTGADC